MFPSPARSSSATASTGGSGISLEGAAFDANGVAVGGALIEGNRVVRAGNGIELFFCSADVVGNETVENTGAGIVRVRSAGLVARNRANANGAGIVSDDSHGAFVRNVTNANDTATMNGTAGVVSLAGPITVNTIHTTVGGKIEAIERSGAGAKKKPATRRPRGTPARSSRR